ncbi:MAG: SMC-Scp complex subunit ScpB [Planctomycetota bacterium]|nr:MAG: SMC-Scp complex subunit ScpB [Planctomycetota bacterium]
MAKKRSLSASEEQLGTPVEERSDAVSNGQAAPPEADEQALAAELGPESATDAATEDATDAALPAVEVLAGEELENAVLALLFASPEALSIARLGVLLPGTTSDAVRDALAALAERMALAKLPLELRELAGGWRVLTTPSQAWIVARLARQRKNEKVSPAALETLAIVAYRQPVTKAEVEAIRGVQAGPVLRSLIDRRLVKVCGRAEQPGSPLQYATTREFLDQFGLASLQELPRDAELVKD